MSTKVARESPNQLRIPGTPGVRVSKRAFEPIRRANPELRMGRASAGELRVMAPAVTDTGARNAGLTPQLCTWNYETGLGVGFDSSAGFMLPSGMIHAADDSRIAKQRWESLPTAERKTFAPTCPDFVAEPASPRDFLKEVRDRLVEFISQGTRLGWLPDPRAGSVEIHRPGSPVEILKRPATLDGEGVSLGFVLDFRGILFD